MADASRRDLLRLGLGLAIVGVPGLTSCSPSDPTVGGSSGRTPTTPSTPTASASASAQPSPSPTTANAAARAAATEQALARLAAAIRRGPHRRDLDTRQRALLEFARDSHAAYATALSPSVPAAPAPKINQLSLSGSLNRLAREQAAAGRRHRQLAVRRSGADALLWASLAAAATSLAGVVTDGQVPTVGVVRTPKPVTVLSDTEAAQEMVRQLHALIYGYQLAIGKLPVVSRQHRQAERELLDHRVRRERLIVWLRRRKAEVPAPEAAYDPSVEPTGAKSAARLVRTMQVALLPFHGLMIAAADDDARGAAITALTGNLETARAWGAPLQAWPGYAR